MSPNTTNPSSSSRSPLLLAVGAVVVVGGIWAVTQGFGSGQRDPGVQEQQQEAGGPSSEKTAGIQGNPDEGVKDPDTGAAKIVDPGKTNATPKPSAGDLALAAKEKGFADIIHEPNSKPKQIVAAIRGLLSDKRIAHAGVAEMLNLLPHAAREKELALGLLETATTYPNEPFSIGLVQVFDDSSDTDVKMAALRAIQKHRQYGFTDAELQRMRRASNDSMVTDEIDRMLEKR